MNNTPLDSFESALLTDLKARVANGEFAADRSTKSPQRKRLAVGATTIAAVAGTAAIAAGLFEPAAAAYTVTRAPAGTIVVTVHRLSDSQGLEKALAARGIQAKVTYRSADAGAAPTGVNLQPAAPDGSMTSGSATASTPVGAGSGVCSATGGMPFTSGQEGSDYVIRIPAGSPLLERGRVIDVVSTGRLNGPVAGLEVSWIDRGVSCGAGSISASAVPTP